jgi:hypothetical protein
MGTLPPGAIIDEKGAGLPPGATVDSTSLSYGQDTAEDAWRPNWGRDNLSDRLKLMAGVGDVALMGASAGVGEVFGGLAGLTALALSGDPDYAKQRAERWQNTITIGPFTEGGKYLLSAVVPPLSKADMAITDFAEEMADGDVGAATAIKTGIWGSIDIAGSLVPGAKAVIGNLKLNKMRKMVVAEAERLGIDIRLEDFADDVADAAKLVGSESRGEAATEYVTALRNAENLAKIKKNSLYLAALDEKLFVATSPVRRMGAELARELDGKFDLDGPQKGMNLVRRSLDDMHSTRLGFGSGQTLAVHFNRFEMLRKRLNSRIRDTASNPKSATAHAALVQIRTKMDDFMTTEFNKAVMENGRVISQGGALSGDTAGFLSYLEARKAATEHAWFNDTKVIADLIKKDTTPEEFSQWLIGASAVGSKKGAAAVVNKMKVMLGEDHPAIAAVRADFIYELTEPLLQLDPNFHQFANNFDKVLRKNKSLADALGLQSSDVASLANFAEVVKQLPPGGHIYTFREALATISRLSVGHGVAKGAARVTFMTKMLNYATGIDAVSPKQILGAIVDVQFDSPMIPKGTPVYSALIAGAALTGIQEEQ